MSIETREVFDAIRENNRNQRRDRFERNRVYLGNAGLVWSDRNDGHAMVFRAASVGATFYPASGKWQVHGGRMMHGGAEAFVTWWRKVMP